MHELVHTYGFKHLYNEDLFYKTHKVSRSDFLAQLKEADESKRDDLIMGLYDDPAHQGRRGILPLKDSLNIVRKKIDDKQRFIKFAEKFGGAQEVARKVPGASYQSFKDLM